MSARSASFLGLLALLAGGCSSSDASPAEAAPDASLDVSIDPDAQADGGTPADDAGDAAIDAKWPGFDPYTIYPASDLGAPRGLALHRGTIHLHSNYSWDACDQLGFVNAKGKQDYDAGTLNESFYQDLRKGLCDTGQEFAFLTDHVDHFPDFEFPDVLLYRASLGDELVMKDGKPVAVKLACNGVPKVLLAAGTDYTVLAIGLDQHVADTPAARREVYGQKTQAAYDTLRANGALVLAGYLPRWDPAQLLGTTFDAVEVYNPIFNFQDRIGEAIDLVLKMNHTPTEVPVPELGLIGIFEENTTILSLWSQFVQQTHVPSFIGSNAHENVLPSKTPDGERFDSYRRLLHWWSNYVQLPSGQAVDEPAVKAALAAGHSFGSFDYLGYPDGFDFHAESGATVFEMGATAATGTADLVAVAPTVHGLKAIDAAPVVTARILKAEGTGWTEVAKGTGTVKVTGAAPGAYRAEVRILPNHLVPNLGAHPDKFLKEQLWVYGNPIWITGAP